VSRGDDRALYVIAAAAGPLLYRAARRDASRHPAGRRLEPRTFVERTNWA
jgi:hypothetical protein